MNTRFLKPVAVAALVLGLSGCGAMVAQNPSGPFSPVNAMKTDTADRLILQGADVVAYFTDNRFEQGSPEFASVYEGVTFHFANAERKAMFDQEPTKYLPEYGGYCANGIMFGIPWGGNATDFSVVDGKLYIFGGEVSQKAFELDLQQSIALADKYWDSEVASSNSFIQRTKRLTVRVPHYQSGEEQARLVQESQR